MAGGAFFSSIIVMTMIEKSENRPNHIPNCGSKGGIEWIAMLTVGNLELEDVSARILTGLRADYVLLGMSFLQAFDLDQRGNRLVIRER